MYFTKCYTQIFFYTMFNIKTFIIFSVNVYIFSVTLEEVSRVQHINTVVSSIKSQFSSITFRIETKVYEVKQENQVETLL